MVRKKIIYFIAGEDSGDYIGSKIIAKLKSVIDVRFVGIGGVQMLDTGLESSLFPITNINIIGFIEVLSHIFSINKLIKKTINNIMDVKPDILITIDSQAFCFQVAKYISKHCSNIKLLHIVAPSVWVNRSYRAYQYAKVFNHLICILPFEPNFFEKFGLVSTYVGHFLFDNKFQNINRNEFRRKYKISKTEKLVCLTPGSREREIKIHLPIFLSAALLIKTKYKIDLVCAIAVSNKHYAALIEKISSGFTDLSIIYVYKNEHKALFEDSDVAIAKSGTNTLELIASNTPLIVAYKIHTLTWLYLKATSKVKYVSLINILANKLIIDELLQKDCNSIHIAEKAYKLLTDFNLISYKLDMAKQVLYQLGFQNREITPVKSVVKIICSMLNDKTT